MKVRLVVVVNTTGVVVDKFTIDAPKVKTLIFELLLEIEPDVTVLPLVSNVPFVNVIAPATFEKLSEKVQTPPTPLNVTPPVVNAFPAHVIVFPEEVELNVTAPV